MDDSYDIEDFGHEDCEICKAARRASLIASDVTAQEADFIVDNGVIVKNRNGATGIAVPVRDGFYKRVGGSA